VVLLKLFGDTNLMIDETQLESLPVDEKLRIVTSLWDQIARSKQPLRVPETVLDEADRRLDEMTADPSSCLTEEEMWRRADDLR